MTIYQIILLPQYEPVLSPKRRSSFNIFLMFHQYSVTLIKKRSLCYICPFRKSSACRTVPIQVLYRFIFIVSER